MKITILEKPLSGLWPLATDGRPGNLMLCGKSWHKLVHDRWNEALGLHNDLTLKAELAFWPSQPLLDQLEKLDNCNFTVVDEEGVLLAQGGKGPRKNALGINHQVSGHHIQSSHSETVHEFCIDTDSVLVKYPWHLLEIQERVLEHARHGAINGIIHEGSVVDGNLDLGDGSIILPGVYIQGNVVIGEHCQIGPNCCIRGNTAIGDNCRIGQGAEIKNSIIMSRVELSHVCYVGDSILASGVDFGSGTMVSNYRHDGTNHFSIVDGQRIDTGRDHFGTVVGENVRTGVNTSIYPGRKIGPGVCTRPGAIVTEDLRLHDNDGSNGSNKA